MHIESTKPYHQNMFLH